MTTPRRTTTKRTTKRRSAGQKPTPEQDSAQTIAGLHRDQWKDQPPWLDPKSGDPLVDFPWDQVPNETDKAYEAFTAYLNMGTDRSVRSLARQWGDSGASSRLFSWSSRWWWTERIRLKARHERRLLHEAQITEAKDMVRFHANLARQALGIVAKRIVGSEAEGIAPLDAGSLNAADVARLLSVASTLERQSRLAQLDDTETLTESLAESLLDSDELQALAARLESLSLETD